MYLPRTIDEVLLAWSRETDRKPLVLRGARQTGKTEAVRRLGGHFNLFLEVNLERFEDLSLVRSCRSADELLIALAARHNLERFPARTLLFLDEIQESPEAVAWLRFFREDHPDLFVVAAGSLLEVRLQERGFSFPVGRVTFRVLRPFTFFEFLAANERDVLARHLAAAVSEGRPIPAPLHEQALELLRDYLLVGGMPEAVSHWTAEHNPATVRRIHRDLVQALAEDLQRFGNLREVGYLEAAFDNLRHHAGLRFRYENFAPGYRSQLMKNALSKLEAALLIHRALPTSSLSLPLRERPRSAAKLLPLDVGLALHTMGSGFDTARSLALHQILDGRVAEIFVGQQLLASAPGFPGELFFWVSESSNNNAEVDYMIPVGGRPVPVEVKSAAAGSLKSLHQFLWRAGLSRGIRLHVGPLADERLEVKMPEGNLAYRLLSVPIYLTEKLTALESRLS
ncbi:MAG: AAA family ATPase [Acidobacteriota bacterium]